MKRTIAFLLLVVLVLLSCISCGNSVEEAKTKLTIRIEDDLQAKTIMPSQSLMETRKYSVTGTGPSNATFGPLISTESSVTVVDLAAGTWTIEAKALNAENNELASGKSEFEIHRGENRVTLALDGISGTGTLELDFRWDKNLTKDPAIRIISSIENSNGVSTSRIKEVYTSDYRATMVFSLSAGCHVLNVQVKDSNGFLGVGATEAVRIVSNTRSSGTVELKRTGTGDNPSNGTEIALKNNVGNPMNFYIDYLPKSPSIGQTICLEALYQSLPAGVRSEELTFQWYKDGIGIPGGTSYAYNTVAERGMHRYDVIVRSRCEGTMCGASMVLNLPF